VTGGPLAQNIWQTLRGQWRLMLAVLPGLGLTMLHSTMLDLPRADVIDAVDSDRYRIQWIAGAFLTGSATGMAMTRFIGSRIGLRRAYLLALVMFSVAGSACGALSEVAWFTPFRLIQGFGSGLILSAAMVMLWRAYPRRRALAMAIYGMGVFVPALAGAPLGGLLVASVSWRLIFFINLPLGLLIGLLARVVLPLERTADHSPSPMDWLGLALLLAWVIPLNVVIDLGQYWGWLTSPSLAWWLACLLVAFAAFSARGILAANPLIDLRILALPHFAVGLGIKVLYSVNLYVLVSVLSGYMIQVRGYQWWQGSLVLLPAVATMLSGIVAGVFIGNDGNRRLRMGFGLMLMCAGTGLLASVDVYTAKEWQAACLAVWGFGAGLVTGPALLTTFEGLSDDDILRSAGVFNVCRAIPVFIATGLLATLMTRQFDTHFDYLRQTVRHNQPAVAGSLRALEYRLAGRGQSASLAAKQSRAELAARAKTNARANAVRDVFVVLAFAPALGLMLVLLIRVPPTAQPEPSGRVAA
jgi:EmrB/QacA subfamily drug resistance transporter